MLGGSAIGFVPGVPEVELDPELVLLIFLPPLLYAAAFFSSLRELRRNVRPIGLLAIGLTLVTMAAVAAIAHAVIGLDWDVAFVLGAVVAPTDVVAPGEIVRRMGVPRRIVTVLEGESLTNDWTALVLYRVAVAAVVSGSFSLLEAGGEFVLSGIGGVAIGVAVGFCIAAIRRRLDDPPTEITISLLTGYAAYLPAEELGVSGIIAAVTVGIYMGWRAPELITATTRIQTFAFWEIVQFLLNAVLFVLVGLQLRALIDELDPWTAGELIGWAALVSVVVIAVRFAWLFLLSTSHRALPSGFCWRDGHWRSLTVIAWSGMRGSVSLAAALAIPFAVDGGGAFPQRDLVIFLTYSVILGTLVLQGLTLGPLIRALRVEDDGLDEQEELQARVETALRGRERIEELSGEEWVNAETAVRLRGLYDWRHRRFSARRDGGGEDDVDYDQRSEAYQRLVREVIAAERARLLELRNEGAITDEVMRRVQRDLDLEESRLED